MKGIETKRGADGVVCGGAVVRPTFFLCGGGAASDWLGGGSKKKGRESEKSKHATLRSVFGSVRTFGGGEKTVRNIDKNRMAKNLPTSGGGEMGNNNQRNRKTLRLERKQEVPKGCKFCDREKNRAKGSI